MKTLKRVIFTSIKWIAAIYAIGYIIFGYPNDTYLMRAINSILCTIFSVNVLIYVLKKIEKNQKPNHRKSFKAISLQKKKPIPMNELIAVIVRQND